MKTEIKEVIGVLWAVRKHYALEFVAVCDKEGNTIHGLYGCMAVPASPYKYVGGVQIYSSPVLVINGVFISRDSSLPKYITVEKEFDWDDLDDAIPDDVNVLMSEMSAQFDGSTNIDKEII